MSPKTKSPVMDPAVATVVIPSGVLDELVKGPMTTAHVQAVSMAFKKALIERAMSAELTHHLGYREGEPRPEGQDNHRNGHKGMTVREIQGFLADQYGTTVSPDFISSVTDEVLAEVTAWQQRPLEPMYPVIFFDALRVKLRDDGVVRNKAVYVALGVLPDGTRQVLGLWIEQTEGAKFWLKVFNELKTRGVHDILIAVVDGLTGLAEAIETAYPRTTEQTCIVHLIRSSLTYVSWTQRKPLAAALRPVYTAVSADAAHEALCAFAASPFGRQHPTIVQSWERVWEHVTPFFAFPPAVRKLIYTTNAIESLHMRLRKIIKTRGHVPTDEAATKLLWLAIQNGRQETVRSVHAWHDAMNQFAVFFGERFTHPQR